MYKRLLASIVLSSLVLYSNLYSQNTGTAPKEVDPPKKKLVEEWQTNPKAFAKLFFGDDLSAQSHKDKTISLRDEKKPIIEKVRGSYVEWPATFGISPLWLGASEEVQKKATDNTAIYSLFGPELFGWILLIPGRQPFESTRLTWGLPPQIEVVLKMKLVGIMPGISKTGQLIINVTGEDFELETSSERCAWPEYSSLIYGSMGTCYEIQVTSEHEFPVKVGLRSKEKGADFIVPARGATTIAVAKGKYDIFFQFVADPTSLYQGDSLDLSSSGVKIQLKGKDSGDYRIRKIK